MHSRSPITRRVSLLLASLMIVFINSIGYAQATSYKASFEQNKEAVAVNVLVGQSRVINFDRPVGRFSVSNPEIAEAVLVTPNQVLVNGKKAASKFLSGRELEVQVPALAAGTHKITVIDPGVAASESNAVYLVVSFK